MYFDQEDFTVVFRGREGKLRAAFLPLLQHIFAVTQNIKCKKATLKRKCILIVLTTDLTHRHGHKIRIYMYPFFFKQWTMQILNIKILTFAFPISIGKAKTATKRWSILLPTLPICGLPLYNNYKLYSN